MIDLALFLQLAASCAPHVAPETLAAVARTESSFEELSIHDNTTSQTVPAAGRAEAVAFATDAISTHRHSVDLGLMQINSANLAWLGMSIADAFDACRSLAAADRVLVAAYVPTGQGGDQQAALRQALSRYNTGDPARGVANGYVARVQAAAEVVVPAISLRAGPANAVQPRSVAPQGTTAPPPAWDVYRQVRAGKTGGALVFGTGGTTNSVLATPSPAPPRPGSTKQAAKDAR